MRITPVTRMADLPNEIAEQVRSWPHYPADSHTHPDDAYTVTYHPGTPREHTTTYDPLTSENGARGEWRLTGYAEYGTTSTGVRLWLLRMNASTFTYGWMPAGSTHLTIGSVHDAGTKSDTLAKLEAALTLDPAVIGQHAADAVASGTSYADGLTATLPAVLDAASASPLLAALVTDIYRDGWDTARAAKEGYLLEMTPDGSSETAEPTTPKPQVSVCPSAVDPGRWLVQIDTEPGTEINIALNDGDLFRGDPEKGSEPLDHPAAGVPAPDGCGDAAKVLEAYRNWAASDAGRTALTATPEVCQHAQLLAAELVFLLDS